MNRLTLIFLGLFGKFDARHAEILDQFNKREITAKSAACEIRMAARNFLAENDRRRAQAFQTLFELYATAFHDGTMSPHDVAFEMRVSARDLFAEKDPYRIAAFFEMMHFWHHTHQDGKMNAHDAAKFVFLSALVALPYDLAKPHASHFFKVHDSEALDNAVELVQSAMLDVLEQKVAPKSFTRLAHSPD